MQLIDKEILLNKLNERLEAAKTVGNAYYDGQADAYYSAVLLTDESQVVEERKSAQWIKENSFLKCSQCSHSIYIRRLKEIESYKTNFCPNCGASMAQEF